jgi:hypothetical protein
MSRPRTTRTPTACRWDSSSSISSRNRADHPDAEDDHHRVRGELRHPPHLSRWPQAAAARASRSRGGTATRFGRWEGDTLVVETTTLRGAEDGPSMDGSTSTAARTVSRRSSPNASGVWTIRTCRST